MREGEYVNTGSVVQARIDTAALRANAAALAARIAPATVMGVLKADAYGHGTRLVAPALYAAGIRDFAVATVPEALALVDLLAAHPGARPDDRGEAQDAAHTGAHPAARPDIRVLCWLFDPSTDLSACTRAGIELGISSPEGLEAAISAGRTTGITQRIHLKVDTGLGRNGMNDSQLDAVLTRLHALGAGTGEATDTSGPVRVSGVMTHFACADDPADPATAAQSAAFAPRLARIESALPAALREEELMVTLANSPAALTLTPVPGTHARLGIGLYGLSPLEGTSAAELGITPVMTLASRVINVKDVPAGHGASYGLTFRTPRDTRFALIAGGYADGLPRLASDRGEITIGATRYPIIGRIAMDQFIVDLGPRITATGQPAAEVSIGDEAIIIGDGVSGPSAEEWAQWCETINYEIVTRIGARVDRIDTGGDDR